jgi:cytochrome c biogenesis protein CcdA/thiol-disulfide isomerase/thioredoxin
MKRVICLAFTLLLLNFSPLVVAEEDKHICAVYFTGVGCPHCAKTDPVVLIELLKEYPNLVIIEYEIYQQQDNAVLLDSYNSHYNSGLGVPLIVFNKKTHIIGDSPILNNVRTTIENIGENGCPLVGGDSIEFMNLDITSLPQRPKIWKNNRILIYNGGGGDAETLKKLLIKENLSEILKGLDFEIIEPKPVPLSGRNVNFENAIKIDGWILQWNGESITEDDSNYTNTYQNESNGNDEINDAQSLKKELTVAKIVSLAAVDAVNPCALAVLTLVLIAIITYNPENKRNILLAGAAFVISVYFMYLFYGLVIIRFFQLIQALTSIRLLLYKILGGAAIVLGLLNVKDFFFYKPGGLGTEMPMKLRPKVKKIISSITSPRGAFVVGLFVTVFLLPCTIGPYIIAGGILSSLELIKTMPWLLIYNIIFVSPMIAITLLVYKGMSTVENVSGWKDRNIRYLHLIAGTIILLLGIGMVLGLV